MLCSAYFCCASAYQSDYWLFCQCVEIVSKYFLSPQIQDRLLIRETLRQLEDHMAQYPQAKRDRIHYNKWRVAQKFPTSEIEEQEDDDLDEEEDRWTFEMSRRYNF